MNQSPMSQDLLITAIHEAARKETQRIVQEETETAQKRVTERMAGMIDRIVLSVLAHYSVDTRGHELVIRVDRRELTQPPA